MMCRNVKVLAAAAVAVVLLAVGAYAQTWNCGSPNAEDVTATLEDGTLTISGTGNMANYTSPYTNIPWYGSRTSITSVVVGAGVTAIGNSAFRELAALTSVTIGNNVTSIGNSAFYQCTGLTSVTIPDGVTSIGTTAFSRCTGLMSVTIGNGVKTIGQQAFNDCSGLTSVTIPNSMTSIESEAFLGCTGLTSVTIPSSVISIGTGAFRIVGTSFTSIVVDDDNANFSSEDGVLFNKAKTTLLKYPGGKQGAYTIPSSVTSIGTEAFYGCRDLTSVTIPSSVTSIELQAFYGCTGLTSVTIPSSVTSIANYAFQGCTGLTSVTIPNSVTSIANYAFQRCTGLTSVTIPNSVTSIGTFAFYQCTGLTSVTIPSSVTSIGNYAFYQCTGLTSVTSLIEVPPTINANVFTNVPLASAVLNVPEGSVEAYKAADVWKDFSDVLSLITVTFDAQDGSAVASQTIPHNGKVSEPEEPTRAGFYFDGWFKEAACTTEWDFAEDVVTEAVTLYAGWTVIPEHTVHFNTQGGSEVSSKHVLEGQKVAEPEDEPTLAGHTFGGWYKEAACTNAWDFAEDVVTDTMTLFAKWTINTYVVTFSAGANGAISAEVDESPIATGELVQYGKSVIFTATPNEGYDVIGWTLNGEEVAGADDNDNIYTLSVSEAAVVAVSFGKTNSVAQSDRAIPTVKPKEEATVVAPVGQLTGEFTAGPNPVAKQLGSVSFFRQGKRVGSGELRIYDATGNVISKVKISDKALNSLAKRQVGTWDLTDKNGRTVSEGTYLVKGVIKTSDGKSEKVSVIVGVR